MFKYVVRCSRSSILYSPYTLRHQSQASLLHDVDTPTQKATFGMGCFWSNDSLFGATPGVVRTRVGYAGGTTKNPHYRSM